MNSLIILILSVVVCGIFAGAPLPACEDTLDADSAVTVTYYDGEVLGNFTKCSKMLRKYPMLCGNHGHPGQRCCQSCEGVDLDCLDRLAKYTINGKEYKSCASLIKKEPCLCAEDKYKDECCSACAGVDTDSLNCDCRDLLSRNRPLELTLDAANGEVVEITSCKKLAKSYPGLCREYKDSLCCVSCQGVEYECLDPQLKTWYRHGKLYDSCKKLIKKLPCECEDPNVKSTCCASCKDVDTAPLNCNCQDTLKYKTPIVWNTSDGYGNIIKTYTLTSCKKLLKTEQKDPDIDLCGQYGNEGEVCCRSCSNNRK